MEPLSIESLPKLQYTAILQLQKIRWEKQYDQKSLEMTYGCYEPFYSTRSEGYPGKYFLLFLDEKYVLGTH